MIVSETDLIKLSRSSNKCLTIVILHLDNFESKRLVWLKFGEAHIRHHEKRYSWWLEAYLKNATDFEHDSAYVLKLPLIGLSFQGVNYHATSFMAWVNPNDPEEFHVPRPGYNPLRHKDTVKCNNKDCKKEPHLIVPEGFYVPPVDLELFEAVKGKQLEIIIKFK